MFLTFRPCHRSRHWGDSPVFALCSVLIARASHPWYQVKASFLLQGAFPVSKLEGGAIPDQPASGPLSDAGVVRLLSLPFPSCALKAAGAGSVHPWGGRAVLLNSGPFGRKDVSVLCGDADVTHPRWCPCALI